MGNTEKGMREGEGGIWNAGWRIYESRNLTANLYAQQNLTQQRDNDIMSFREIKAVCRCHST